MTTLSRTQRSGAAGIGAPVERPDGIPKTEGRFAFSSDLFAEGMLWGQVVRSPHPSARIRSVDTAGAWAVPGVRAVIGASDVPGATTFGLEVADQPVFAGDVVRYMGEPILAIAAEHPEAARRAAKAVVVEWEVQEPLVDPEAALEAEAIHPLGNVVRHVEIVHGDQTRHGEVVVEGVYEVGMQDQAFLGPESGLAIPADDGGVDLWISTQWLHVDRAQVARCLALPEEKVRLHLAGVGGAFGAREDVSIQVHICLLALVTRRPVKMVLGREESFFSHVHRHPARLWMRHEASRDGELVRVDARVLLDGGAYTSSSPAVIANATCFASGPYRVPVAHVEGWVVRTNNPPCGAMRGFGAVQACFAHEAQMDKLAAALGVDPLSFRRRHALATGDTLITGQVIRGSAPLGAVIDALAALPLPDPEPDDAGELTLPGGVGRAAERSRVRRGVGFACGYKNLMYSEGFDDAASARCRLERGVVTVTSAAAEVGQGLVTLIRQIVVEELGVEEVVLAPAETTTIGSAGSTSASRQSWMTGGAVQAAASAVASRVRSLVAERLGIEAEEVHLAEGRVRVPLLGVDEDLARALGDEVVEETVEFHHAPTSPLDERGQGDAHVAFAFGAHRAVVDVDLDLGLVKVVELATAQDVGRVLNPLGVLGQVEGGSAQGLGLAVMEEIVVDRGRVVNPSFTDYLIPTTLDMPPVRVAALIEEPEPGAPFGAKGVGEPPTISSTPAIVAAIRAATGLELTRVPVRPEHLALRRRQAAEAGPR